MSVEVTSATEVRHQLDRSGWAVFGLILLPTAVALLALLRGLPWPVMFVLPVVLGAVWILRAPVIGLYTLFVGALVIPVQGLGFPDALTDNIPFFANLSDGSSLNLSGLGISPAEIVMVITLLGVVGILIADQSVPKGRLMGPAVVFGAVVGIGELNGLVHGGDFKLSLWELRPPIYALVMFMLASVLIKDRAQLKILLGILLLSELFVGATGVYRYFVTLDRSVANAIPILGHEDSYLLSLFITGTAIGLVWYRRRLVFFMCAVSPIIVTALVENHRRAGTGAMALEILIVLVLAYFLEPRLRKTLATAFVVMTIAGIVFVIVFWNQQYGAVAELIRPVKSLVDPTARDLSSDLYRVAETANLKLTYRTSPILGIGFGHPYYIVSPQTGVQKFDPLWNIIPHNNLLWIPMRMGIVGLVGFWCLISLAVIEAIWVARSVSDRLVRLAMVFAVAAMFGLLFNAYYDISIANYRDAIVLGMLLAVVNRGSSLARHEEPSPEAGEKASGASTT